MLIAPLGKANVSRCFGPTAPVARRTRFLVSLFLIAVMGPAWADQPAFDADSVQATATRLDQIDQTLRRGAVGDDQLVGLSNEVSSGQGRAQDCITAQESATAKIAQQLASLGPVVAGESAQAAKTRTDLQRQQFQAAALLSDCRLLHVKSGGVLQALSARQSARLTNRLLTRGPTTTSLIRTWIARPPAPGSLLDLQALSSRLGTANTTVGLWLGALALFGLTLGLLARRRMRRSAPIDPERDLGGAVLQGITLSLGYALPGLSVGVLWSLYWLIRGPEPAGWPLLAEAAFTMLGFQLVLVAIRAAFNPPHPAGRYLRVPKDLAQRFACSLRRLALISFVGALLFVTPIAQAASPDLLMVTRSLWGTFFVASLIWTVWQIRRIRGKGGVGLIRLAIAMALLGALGAEWLGYRDLSVFVGAGVALTLICLLADWLVATLGDDFIDSLDEGRHAWQQRLRARLGVAPESFIPGLFWLRVLFELLIWLALGLALLDVWGLPDSA